MAWFKNCLNTYSRATRTWRHWPWRTLHSMLVNPDENIEKLLSLGAKVHYGDLLDKVSLDDLMKREKTV